MALISLEVSALRNLASASLSPSSGLNLLFGANGSGKTSLLEAIHLLGMARSFRTTQARKLIQAGLTAATVFGRVDTRAMVYGVGVQKQLGDVTQIRVNGERLDSASALAGLLPLQLITPESHSLLQGEPRERRAYLDWGLFHVEHGFLELWKRYRRYLEQRNAGLRSGASPAEMLQWEQGLAECGESVAHLRTQYLEQIAPFFNHIYSVLVDDDLPQLTLRRGWSKEQSLRDALVRNRGSEQAVGYTMSGPHRADLRLVLGDGRDAADTFSRGQQKLVVCAMRLAQMQHLQSASGKRCTLLLDDLPAELDADKRRLLLQAVADSGAQCFITATDSALIDLAPWSQVAVFHVERGAVAEVV
jgi:DNA replication and repair protein RecF